MVLIRCLIVAAVAVLALAASPTLPGPAGAKAHADTFTWRIRNRARYAVRLKFHSKSRRVVWPSSNRSWLLDDERVRSFPISCRRGEKICYGGFYDNNRHSWGVGRRGRKSCRNCCYTCTNGQSRIHNLTGG